MQSLIEQYDVELQEQHFTDLVAHIYTLKVQNNYTNIEIQPTGGWYISREDQLTQKAERIADAIIATGL